MWNYIKPQLSTVDTHWIILSHFGEWASQYNIVCFYKPKKWYMI